MKIIDVKGDIVVNDYSDVYEWFGWDYISPAKVKAVLDTAEAGEDIEVNINSNGGHVMAGQEIYSMLRDNPNVTINVQGMACSAASIIAMAGHSTISPVGMLMIHNVSGSSDGDYHTMEKTAEALKQMNEALAAAYAAKTGIDMDTLIQMMDKETWITANQAIANHFIDEITPAANASAFASNAIGGIRLTNEDMKRYQEAKRLQEQKAKESSEKSSILSDIDLISY